MEPFLMVPWVTVITVAFLMRMSLWAGDWASADAAKAIVSQAQRSASLVCEIARMYGTPKKNSLAENLDCRRVGDRGQRERGSVDLRAQLRQRTTTRAWGLVGAVLLAVVASGVSQ